MASGDKCPVDHSALASSSSAVPQEKCPVDHSSMHAASSDEKCPVEPAARSSWTSWFSTKDNATSSTPTSAAPANTSRLPTEREISSIPRVDGTNWVYPSQAQFYAAMERKKHNPNAPDMKVIVPIHNAVNERAWAELMKWEAGQGGDKCGGVKLVSFKGRPQDRTPKARWKMLMGYSAPFDRHDWVVDRCGTRMRYVIDFYTGHSTGPSANNVSFYLDVRPALDNWEGVRLRATHFWERWVGSIWNTSPPPKTASTQP
ncbi:cytochrome c and c1 heme-lyase [Trametopsis cervina]|nr:cytochrome c and c1 heme-lyase [Trametopsis cervina]